MRKRPSRRAGSPINEAPLTKWILIALAVSYLSLFLLLPLLSVFVEALRPGLDAYLSALSDSDARAAIRLTLVIAAISVPANLIFGPLLGKIEPP